MTNVHDFFETNYKFFNRTLPQNPHVVQGSTFFFFFFLVYARYFLRSHTLRDIT